jgi:DNA polymerase III delta subunit
MKKVVIFNGTFFKETTNEAFDWACKRENTGYVIVFEGTLADFAKAKSEKSKKLATFEEVAFNCYILKWVEK